MRFAPKKSLGQNFLQDKELCRWMVDTLEPDTAPVVLEIGPGQGALTEHLLGRPRKLWILEKDDAIAAHWKDRLAGRDDAEVWHGDAARFDLRPFFKHGEVKVVGNLPYSMGNVILQTFLRPPTPVTEAVFMLQKEVCERIAATEKDDSYGALSVLVQQDWKVEMLRIVPPEVFVPRPKVHSAIIRLTPRGPGELPVYDRAWFDRLVRTGFSQRRKQLKNLLPEGPLPWGEIAARLGKSLTVRSEELSIRDWVQLARIYEQRHEEDRGQKATEMFDVVDENNQVIEQRPRAEVHAKGLKHRAVHVFVFNRHGELWLQQRSHLKDVHPLGWDSSAAGHLDAGEDYATAAVRELQEELGITAETHCVARIPACEDTGWEFVELHCAKHDGPMRFAPDEIRTGGFFTVEQIVDWVAARPQDFARGFIRCLELWRKSQPEMV